MSHTPKRLLDVPQSKPIVVYPQRGLSRRERRHGAGSLRRMIEAIGYVNTPFVGAVKDLPLTITKRDGSSFFGKPVHKDHTPERKPS